MRSDPIVIEATYRITTPMFCGGADPQESAELRLPSFKGALRFWWRSLRWRDVQDPVQLSRLEADLFGSSDQSVGRSKVALRWIRQAPEPARRRGTQFEGGKLQGIHYLGYGVMEAFDSAKTGKKAGELIRPMIPGGEFTVGVRLDSRLSDGQRREVRDALILLGTVGGLGSKNRKGLGSLTLTSLVEAGKDVALQCSAAERLQALLKEACQARGLPEWTAWSRRSRVVVARGGKDAWKLLDHLGREILFFRSWGHKGKILGRDAEKNFQEDHDLFKRLPVGIDHPRRAVFGLPHNYGKEKKDQVVPASKDYDRRASPLFFHIHQLAENKEPEAVICFLPARFLPRGEKLMAFGRAVPVAPDPQLWYPIHGFLDRLLNKGDTSPKEGLSCEEVELS